MVLFCTLLFKKKSFGLKNILRPVSVMLLPFSVKQEAAKTYLLLQDRPDSRGTCFDLPPPQKKKPSSGTMIKTKPQWFIRQVWELFPVDIWKLSVPVPSTMLLPITTSIGIFWFKPYGGKPGNSDILRLEGNSVITCVFALNAVCTVNTAEKWSVKIWPVLFPSHDNEVAF